MFFIAMEPLRRLFHLDGGNEKALLSGPTKTAATIWSPLLNPDVLALPHLATAVCHDLEKVSIVTESPSW